MHKSAFLILLYLSSLALSTNSYAEPQAKVEAQSLLDIYHLALAHDPALASALNANKAAQELIEQGRALYRPTVNFNADVNASQSDIKISGQGYPFGNQGKNSFEGYDYGVEARQPIYRKQNLVQMDQAKTQANQADKQYLLSQQALILRTTQAYFDVLIAQENINLIQAQKQAILRQLEQAKANFDVGSATVTDVNEAQARYDLTLAQEIAANNQFEIAQRAVQVITGELPEKLSPVKSTVAVVSAQQTMADWQQLAEKNNLSIQIQQDALQLAEQQVTFANAGHLPTLDAVASYSKSYANGSINGYGSDLKTGVVGLQLQIPLYQGGAISSQARQAVYNQQKAQDDLELARRQANLETQRAYLNVNTSAAQVKALEQALVSSQQQLESTQLGYEVGVRTSVDVLNAQQQLFAAKRDLMQARSNYLVNIISLKSVSGVVSESDLAEINQQLMVANHE